MLKTPYNVIQKTGVIVRNDKHNIIHLTLVKGIKKEYSMLRIITIIFIILMLPSYYCSAEYLTCGSSSLLIIINKFNMSADIIEIQQLSGFDVKEGTTMLGLKSASEKLGLPVVAAKLTIEQLRHVDGPVILWVDGNHFLVVHGRSLFGLGKDFIIEDPPKGKQTLSAADLMRRWNGEALVYSERLVREMQKQQEKRKRENQVYGPAVVFDETAGFFGTVSEGENVKHTFTFTNTGTDTLTIRTRPNCSCTVAANSGNTIAPGKTGSITIMFDTTGRSGFTSQSTMVQTNDPSNKQVKLVVAGAVARGIKTLPGRLYVGDVPQGNVVHREVMVLGDGVSPIAIRRIDAPPGYAIETGAAVSDSVYGNYLPLKVRFAAGEVQRKIDDTIVLHMESGKTLEVSVSGHVVGLYKAYPPIVVFNGYGERPSMLTSEITLVPTTDKAPEIRVGDMRGLTVQLKHMDDRTWRIDARVDLTNIEADKNNEIRVYAHDADEPLLVLPVMVVEAAVR